jgi:hypothetical protein
MAIEGGRSVCVGVISVGVKDGGIDVDVVTDGVGVSINSFGVVDGELHPIKMIINATPITCRNDF